MDDTSPPPLLFNVTAGRVEHYNDVVDYLVQQQVYQAAAAGWTPSAEEINNFRKKIISLAVIRHDIDGAAKLKLRKRQVLLEKK